MNEMERAIRSCENKIAEYESHLAKPHHYHRQCRRSIQLEQVKIAALRSEAEREKGCGYCNKERHCIREAFDEGTAQIIDAENHYALSIDTSRDAAIFNIFCCPMCGKRLEVEP